MLVKERFKALVFAVSLLTIGLVGNFPPNLFENAEAHHGSIQQWSVTWIQSETVKSKYKGKVWKSCPYSCGDKRLADKYEVTKADFKITRNYLNDGHSTRYMENKTELSGTRRVSTKYLYWNHYKTNSLNCHNGN